VKFRTPELVTVCPIAVVIPTAGKCGHGMPEICRFFGIVVRMYCDIVEARPLKGYRLDLRFEDGVEGVVDLGQHLRFEGSSSH
jgi:hypothetical protein